MSKLQVGFNNGIGNWIMFTPALKNLILNLPIKYDGIEIWLEESRLGNATQNIKDLISLYSKELSLTIKNYTGKNRLSKHTYMSRHNNVGKMYNAFHHLEQFDPNLIPDWANTLEHETEFYLREIGEKYDFLPISYSLLFPKNIWGELDKKILSPYICISNGWLKTESLVWGRKSYPLWEPTLITLGKMFPKLTFVLLGGDTDQLWANMLISGLENKIRNPVISFAGKVSLGQTCRIIYDSQLLLSTDTGIAHLAASLRAASIVLFGSTLSSKNSPKSPSTIILQSPLTCAPCQGTVAFEVCSTPGLCMRQIPPSWIISTAIPFLL
jgi:ADP-heptose:LPS heptosyltransferase